MNKFNLLLFFLLLGFKVGFCSPEHKNVKSLILKAENERDSYREHLISSGNQFVQLDVLIFGFNGENRYNSLIVTKGDYYGKPIVEINDFDFSYLKPFFLFQDTLMSMDFNNIEFTLKAIFADPVSLGSTGTSPATYRLSWFDGETLRVLEEESIFVSPAYRPDQPLTGKRLDQNLYYMLLRLQLWDTLRSYGFDDKKLKQFLRG